ncbi:hypothetical protein QE152_g4115 [Popillia japonica]|uniref:Uncharacterized protein n=1 Tax=Popillia japonica TaxID=7064 RepID=A0AAW1N1J0_POPJA
MLSYRTQFIDWNLREIIVIGPIKIEPTLYSQTKENINFWRWFDYDMGRYFSRPLNFNHCNFRKTSTFGDGSIMIWGGIFRDHARRSWSLFVMAL